MTAVLDGNTIREQWTTLKTTQPHLRNRDIAEHLQISEAQLIASKCGDTVTRLKGPWAHWLEACPQLGQVMALTRNDSAVHEKYGTYQNVKTFGNMGLVLDEAIDLRVFFNHWHYGFAVTEETRSGLRHSLQFFDIDGTAIHKIYLTADSDPQQWQQLANQLSHADQTPQQAVMPLPAPPAPRPDTDIDVVGFREHWRALQDTHDFFDLLKTFGVTRLQGLRLAGADLAYSVPPTSLKLLLESAAANAVPIMVFVGSRGVIQIHTGPVHNLKAMNEWYNVLDPNFNLHMRETDINSAWVVKKPTVDGVVTSLELFDAEGNNIAMLFGKRKPGIPEDEAWRELVAALPDTVH